MRITTKIFIDKIDLDELNQQIKDLLESNIPENSKEGLHNLLGVIKDQVLEQNPTLKDNYESLCGRKEEQ